MMAQRICHIHFFPFGFRRYSLDSSMERFYAILASEIEISLWDLLGYGD